MQIVIGTAHQGQPISFGSGLQRLCLQLRKQKGINGILRPGDLRHFRTLRLLEGPPLALRRGGHLIGPWSAGIDPVLQDRDLIGGERLARRHRRQNRLGHCLIETAFAGIAGQHGRSMLTALQQGLARVQAQAGHIHCLAVAALATLLQYRERSFRRRSESTNRRRR